MLPKEQYDFAVSFIRRLQTIEFALKEFINKNKDNQLAEGTILVWRDELDNYTKMQQPLRWLSKLSKK